MPYTCLEEGRLGSSFWHWGDQGTARCFVVAYPDSRDALVYFTNSANGLAIGPELFGLVFDDHQWALRWLDYDAYDDPGHVAKLAVTQAFVSSGTEAGVAEFERVKVEYPDVLEEALRAAGRLKESISMYAKAAEMTPRTRTPGASYWR